MTDFRARGTIMGPTGLTAVFGMGTGVTPSVWSPEIRPADVFQSAGRDFDGLVVRLHRVFRGSVRDSTTDPLVRIGESLYCRPPRIGSVFVVRRRGPIGVVKPLGC